MFGTFFFNPVWEIQSDIIVSFLKEGVYMIHFQCHHQQQGFHFTVRDITCPGNHEQSLQFSILESSLALLDSQHLVGATVGSNTVSFKALNWNIISLLFHQPGLLLFSKECPFFLSLSKSCPSSSAQATTVPNFFYSTEVLPHCPCIILPQFIISHLLIIKIC